MGKTQRKNCPCQMAQIQPKLSHHIQRLACKSLPAVGACKLHNWKVKAIQLGTSARISPHASRRGTCVEFGPTPAPTKYYCPWLRQFARLRRDFLVSLVARFTSVTLDHKYLRVLLCSRTSPLSSLFSVFRVITSFTYYCISHPGFLPPCFSVATSPSAVASPASSVRYYPKECFSGCLWQYFSFYWDQRPRPWQNRAFGPEKISMMLLVNQYTQKSPLALRMSWSAQTFNGIATENMISRVSSLTNRSNSTAGSSPRPGKRLKKIPESGSGTLNVESNSSPRSMVHPSNMMYLSQASSLPHGEQNKKESILCNTLFNTDRPSPIITNSRTGSASKYLSEGATFTPKRFIPHLTFSLTIIQQFRGAPQLLWVDSLHIGSMGSFLDNQSALSQASTSVFLSTPCSSLVESSNTHHSGLNHEISFLQMDFFNELEELIGYEGKSRKYNQLGFIKPEIIPTEPSGTYNFQAPCNLNTDACHPTRGLSAEISSRSLEKKNSKRNSLDLINITCGDNTKLLDCVQKTQIK
ncbi:hypothetical protein VP01_1100g1 [Puccinia sorghi]|uniref:Uncharacterized protein n=1 Tax=Puccinia sorghi TaxID=27349 RepID=A0A0L6VSW1_9BASI|nr:hypothetical protein VP01_1100g1 [Puccinia sorghi]